MELIIRRDKCFYPNWDRIISAGVADDRIREADPTRGSPVEDSPTLKSVRIL